MKFSWKSFLQNLAMVVVLILTYSVGVWYGERELKREAARLGYGSFYIDSDFIVQWKWLTLRPLKTPLNGPSQ